MEQQKLSIGRIVHYHVLADDKLIARPAIITHVYEGEESACDITVFPGNGVNDIRWAKLVAEPEAGNITFPPRV